MGTVPAKNRGFGKYILKSPFRFSGKVRKSWSRLPEKNNRYETRGYRIKLVRSRTGPLLVQTRTA